MKLKVFCIFAVRKWTLVVVDAHAQGVDFPSRQHHQ